MNPTILGGIGPGFLNQVPTIYILYIYGVFLNRDEVARVLLKGSIRVP